MNELRSHDNRAEFQRLEKEDSWLTAANITVGGTVAVNIVIPEPLTKLGSILAGTATTSLLVNRTQKINSIFRNAKVLDEAFQERQIQIFVDLPMPDHGRLDLFVEFPLPPKKAVFAIAFRSQGKSTILYNERKESFYIRRGDAGLKRWTPDHVERLGVQGFWLRMNRQEELFGTSRNDRNRPIVKLLVVTGQTKIKKHSDTLYTTVGDQTVLLIQRRSSIYCLQSLGFQLV